MVDTAMLSEASLALAEVESQTVHFSQEVRCLSPGVLHNSQDSKMDDSLDIARRFILSANFCHRLTFGIDNIALSCSVQFILIVCQSVVS
jgi:hypothetical protein